MIKTTTKNTSRIGTLLRTVAAGTALCVTTSAFAIIVSLKTVPIPVPLDIGNYISNQFAAEQLGKAFFWDMQVGSDGVQACATCHFHAGADSRTRNQLNPKDGQFGNNNLGLPAPAPDAMTADQAVTPAHFPLHRLANQQVVGEPLSNPTNVVRDTNDVMGSKGLMKTQFNDIVIGSAIDDGTLLPDPVFNVNGENVRQVTGRNTPSAINAVFNFENFHDGRANNIFNGANPFGPADPRPHVLTNTTGSLATEELRIRQSSLASQAVGPPMDSTEMSFAGRTFPKLGKKMLSLRPLAQQQVSTNDSRLGFLSQGAPGGTGLNTTYAAMIQAAFPAKYWNNTTQKVVFDANGIPSFLPGPADPLNTDEFTQMEANFAFFWGLAVQMYETTLVANNSKFDEFMDGSGALTNEEILGMNTFIGAGGCILCHDNGELMDIGTRFIQGRDPVTDIPVPFNLNPLAANEFMQIATGFGIYDNGFHNTGVRPQGNPDINAPDHLAVNEDVGRGGTTGLGGGMTEVALSKGILGLQNLPAPFEPTQMTGLAPLPTHMAGWVPRLPLGFLPSDTTPFAGRVTNFGAIKTPHLRNVALTGPYMHNGGLSTLRQVTDFYVRGGDFPTTNNMNFDSQGLTVLPLLRDAGAIPGLPTPEEQRDALTQFMMALTDSRVANEEAPFDHPELFVPITGTAPLSPGRDGMLANNTDFQRVPPVGSAGRSAQGIQPLGTFLGLNPRSAALVPDADLDLIEDSADNCPTIANPGLEDIDGDGLGDVCDTCPNDPDNDSDGDGVCGDVDNCPLIANADQTDTDGDLLGDACDDDDDNDTVLDTADNCPLIANTDQLDTDGDLLGDACDDDDDNDTVLDTIDNCPLTANTDQLDGDTDGIGDVCDTCPIDPDNDIDADGFCADVDNCPLTANADQLNSDVDGFGNACDNCTLVDNADQRDTDGDLYGNSCDADLNNSGGTVNLSDYSLFRSAFGANASTAPLTPEQENADFNGDGNVNLSDYSIFRSSFGKAPGPSGFIAVP